MRETNDGFRIAEEDLRLRGAGEILGTASPGEAQFRLADPDRSRSLRRWRTTTPACWSIATRVSPHPARLILLYLMGKSPVGLLRGG